MSILYVDRVSLGSKKYVDHQEETVPTVRIISLRPNYDRLAGHRRDIAAALRATAANTLHHNTEGVEAFWFAPIDPDDAINVLPYSIDVEFSDEVSEPKLEELANALLWVFIDDPKISPNIPWGTTIGVWIKTPGRFFWKEHTKSMDRSVGQSSVFPFFDGDRQLVLIAPDHPDAPYDDRRHNEPLWDIWTQAQDGEKLATRAARRDTGPDQLWSEVSSALYQSVSSNETDRQTPEIRAWLKEVYTAYHERIASSLTVVEAT